MAQVVKNLPVNAEDQRCGFDPWVRKISWRRAWRPTLVFLSGESREQRNLVGYSPRGHKEADKTERLNTLTLLFKGHANHHGEVHPLRRPLLWSTLCEGLEFKRITSVCAGSRAAPGPAGPALWSGNPSSGLARPQHSQWHWPFWWLHLLWACALICPARGSPAWPLCRNGSEQMTQCIYWSTLKGLRCYNVIKDY